MNQDASRGFTLIELLIVVVVIGILATIAIPKFSAMREKSFVAAVTSDLKNLASQQEIYLSDQYSYTNVVRWASEIQKRPAVQRGQRVNKAWGPEEERVPVRHSANDLD